MNQGMNLVVVGASGLIGEAVLEILETREFPVAALTLLDGGENIGKQLQFKDKSHRVEAIESFDFSQSQVAIFAGDAELSEEYAQIAADQGCVVIDSSDCFRSEYDVPLIVAGVNDEQLGGYASRGLISVPGAMATSVVMAVAPVHRQAAVKRITLATYQAVSSQGKAGVEELAGQTARLLNGQTPETKQFPKQIAFNVIPQMQALTESGYCMEELQLMADLKKVLGEEVQVNPTCVQVPVFFGHGAALNLECWDPISAEETRELYTYTEGVTAVEGEDGVPTAVTDAAKSDELYISRIREDLSCENALNLWVLADNIKSVALNCVRIAEVLNNQYL